MYYGAVCCISRKFFFIGFLFILMASNCQDSETCVLTRVVSANRSPELNPALVIVQH